MPFPVRAGIQITACPQCQASCRTCISALSAIDMMDRLAVNFGAEILKIIPGRDQEPGPVS